ncbi:MAG: ISAs1 family transposase [Bacteroidota bacterium]
MPLLIASRYRQIPEHLVIEDLTLLDDDQGWPSLATLIRIEAQRMEKPTGKTTTSSRYYISSKKEKARVFNASIHAHWRIENNLHWMLDVLFKEDASRKRKGYRAENFSIISKMALTLIERNTDKIPKSQKIQRAAYNSAKCIFNWSYKFSFKSERKRIIKRIV